VGRFRQEEFEIAGETRIVRMDDDPVPVTDAHGILGQPPDADAGASSVVIVSWLGERRAFAVSEFVGEHHVIQRPAGSFLEASDLIRGAAILEDGQMAVSVDVPTLMRNASRVRRSPSTSGPERKHSGTIVVADDSELTRDVVVGMLRDGGYEVGEACDGQAALALLEAGSADLLLTDLQMPVMDGFALVKAVRQRTHISDLPVVVLSTLGSEADRQQAARVGADAYVVKSELQASRLLDTVGRFVQARLERAG